MSTDDYYEHATVTLCVDVRIEWRRGSDAARSDALEAAKRLSSGRTTYGAALGGCYGAHTIPGTERVVEKS